MRKTNTKLVLTKKDKEIIKKGLWSLETFDESSKSSCLRLGYKFRKYRNGWLVYTDKYILEPSV